MICGLRNKLHAALQYCRGAVRGPTNSTGLSNEGQFVLLFIYLLAGSFDPSLLNRQMIKFSDLSYKFCHITVDRRYANWPAKYTINYSNEFRCFNCHNIAFMLADLLYNQKEHDLSESIMRRSSVLKVKCVLYMEVSLPKTFTTLNAVCTITHGFGDNFYPFIESIRWAAGLEI